MFGLGTTELIVILLVALLLFGGAKLADIGKGLGEGVRNFKKGMRDAQKEDEGKDAAKDKS